MLPAGAEKPGNTFSMQNTAVKNERVSLKLKGMSPVQFRTHSMQFNPSKFLGSHQVREYNNRMFFKSKRNKITIFAIYFLFCSSLLAFFCYSRARTFLVSVYASKDFFQLALFRNAAERWSSRVPELQAYPYFYINHKIADILNISISTLLFLILG